VSNPAQPLVQILMGSDSDLPVMMETAKILDRMGVPFDLAISSAHRSPARTEKIVKDATTNGVKVFIAGAGAAAHLAGVIASHTVLPVLGVPLSATDLQGMDALLATVQMPAGIPVGTLAIGKAGAANAAWLACGILAAGDDELLEKLQVERAAMTGKVEAKSTAAQARLAEHLGK
jgi:phosphoribosylaminoimidazole carboxylase PurE protein